MLFVDAVQVPHEALPLKPVPGKPGTYVRKLPRQADISKVERLAG